MPKAAQKQPDNAPQSHAFNAEIASVLNLMIHALYTNRDIFLRELISNASDACDKLRYQALSDQSLYEDNTDLSVSIAFDKDANTITITDSGIGMNESELIENLGTIARSGTREFLAAAKAHGNVSAELIGQFGVGFYSAFMVADTVHVRTRKAGEKQGYEWQSDGKGAYTITACDMPARGTEITLHLKDDAKEYLDTFKLQFIAKAYSDHISFPIFMTNAEGEKNQINSASAIWARPKNEVTQEQYLEFYRASAHMPGEPFLTLHNHAEGTVEYQSLLYIPSSKPLDLFTPERRTRVKLYVKRVFITEEGVELIPPYLRFLRGVIDSADLPLNISRETLQKNPVLGKIRDAVTSKVLAELKKKSESDADAYQGFWNNFGAVLKEGLCEATSPRDKILEVCRFYSSNNPSETTSLADYITRMKEGQDSIYYITGDSAQALSKNPHLEGFKARGLEVLLLTDHVDDFWINVTLKYKDISFKSVVRSSDVFENESGEDLATTEGVSAFLAAMKELFGDEVKEVRTTKKLSESPCCLAVSDGDMDIRMEKFLMEHNQLSKRMPKILEINPSHALITQSAEHFSTYGMDDALKERCWLFLDQARLAEGEPLSDMAAFLSRLNAQMLKAS